MPAFHAARTLEQTVAAIPPGLADEVILVDDASRDETVAVARDLGLQVHVHPANRGYGGNQKSCYSLALDSGASIVVLLHPDYQYEPKAVPLLIAPILAGDADMTFGSRFAGMGDPRAGGMPLYRYVGNRLTTIIQNLLLGTHFSEMHSGMRAYTRDALLSLPFLAYPEGFSFDAALLIDAVSSGLRVVEVPIPTRYTKESSSISIGRSFRYVLDGCALALRATVLRGRRGSRYLPGWRRSGRGAVAWTRVDVAQDTVGRAVDTDLPPSDEAFDVDAAVAMMSAYHDPTRVIVVVGSKCLATRASADGWNLLSEDIDAGLSSAMPPDGLLAWKGRLSRGERVVELAESQGFRIVGAADLKRHGSLRRRHPTRRSAREVLFLGRPQN